ncbi:hypothetical protein ADUPG1_009360 [Aduncisulcus paluster]|uniref:Uncharacterized protein n=1 Tax=Aduncisulcus paluster TaxID=2918883 RepID=A0ABQ5KY73_9EUKA|nr:hypothetical protein ADUPG1_009360 [Aduncisulcus paluster]
MYDKVEHIPKQYVEKWLRILMNFLPAICESSDGTKRQYLSVFVQGKLEFQLYPDKADVVSFLFRASKIPRSKDSFLNLIEKLNVIRHVNEWLDEFKADHNSEAIDSWANLVCELFKYNKTNYRVCLECLKHGCVLALLNLDGNDMTKIVKCALNNSRKLLKDGVEAVSSQKISWEQFDEEYCSKVLPDNIEHSNCIPSIHSPQSKNVRISSNYVEIVSSWIDILTIVCQNDAKCEQESARRYAIIFRFLHIITEDMLSIFSPENLLNERDEKLLWKNVHKVIEFVYDLYRIYVYQKERPKILDDLFECVKKLIKPWMKHYASVQSEHASFDNLILDLSKHHYHCYYEIQKECVPELMNYKKHHPDFSLRFNDIYIKSVFSILEEIKIYRSIPEYDDKVKRGFRYLDEILSKSLHHSDQDKGKIEKAMKPGYVSSLCLGLLEMMKNAESTPTIGVSTPHPQASPNESVRKLFEKFNPSLSNVIVCNAESHPGEKDSKDIQETVRLYCAICSHCVGILRKDVHLFSGCRKVLEFALCHGLTHGLVSECGYVWSFLSNLCCFAGDNRAILEEVLTFIQRQVGPFVVFLQKQTSPNILLEFALCHGLTHGLVSECGYVWSFLSNLCCFAGDNRAILEEVLTFIQRQVGPFVVFLQKQTSPNIRLMQPFLQLLACLSVLSDFSSLSIARNKSKLSRLKREKEREKKEKKKERKRKKKRKKKKKQRKGKEHHRQTISPASPIVAIRSALRLFFRLSVTETTSKTTKMDTISNLSLIELLFSWMSYWKKVDETDESLPECVEMIIQFAKCSDPRVLLHLTPRFDPLITWCHERGGIVEWFDEKGIVEWDDEHILNEYKKFCQPLNIFSVLAKEVKGCNAESTCKLWDDSNLYFKSKAFHPLDLDRKNELLAVFKFIARTLNHDCGGQRVSLSRDCVRDIYSKAVCVNVPKVVHTFIIADKKTGHTKSGKNVSILEEFLEFYCDIVRACFVDGFDSVLLEEFLKNQSELHELIVERIHEHKWKSTFDKFLGFLNDLSRIVIDEGKVNFLLTIVCNLLSYDSSSFKFSDGHTVSENLISLLCNITSHYKNESILSSSRDIFEKHLLPLIISDKSFNIAQGENYKLLEIISNIYHAQSDDVKRRIFGEIPFDKWLDQFEAHIHGNGMILCCKLIALMPLEMLSKPQYDTFMKRCHSRGYIQNECRPLEVEISQPGFTTFMDGKRRFGPANPELWSGTENKRTSSQMKQYQTDESNDELSYSYALIYSDETSE